MSVSISMAAVALRCARLRTSEPKHGSASVSQRAGLLGHIQRLAGQRRSPSANRAGIAQTAPHITAVRTFWK